MFSTVQAQIGAILLCLLTAFSTAHTPYVRTKVNSTPALSIRYVFAYDMRMEHSPRHREKDGRTLVLAAAIIVGLRLARDPRAGCLTERVIHAVEDGLFLANKIYDKALFRFGDVTGFRWD